MKNTNGKYALANEKELCCSSISIDYRNRLGKKLSLKLEKRKIIAGLVSMAIFGYIIKPKCCKIRKNVFLWQIIVMSTEKILPTDEINLEKAQTEMFVRMLIKTGDKIRILNEVIVGKA